MKFIDRLAKYSMFIEVEKKLEYVRQVELLKKNEWEEYLVEESFTDHVISFLVLLDNWHIQKECMSKQNHLDLREDCKQHEVLFVEVCEPKSTENRVG